MSTYLRWHWQAFTEPRSLDRYLLLATLLLLALGLVLVSTSAINFATVQYGNPWHFIQRQLIFLAMAAVLALVVMRVPSELYYRCSAGLLLLGLVLLILVLVPGIGIETNGSRRWLPLGIFNLQPSEAAKLSLVVYFASYLARRGDEVRTRWTGFVKPIVILMAYAGLVMVQPDWGATAVLVVTTAAMLFLAGARLGWYVLGMLIAVLAMAFLAVQEDYRIARLLAFMDPWAPEHIHGAGYQLTQALIGIGRGGWLGEGLGNSMQKLAFLPEAHTDFIFAIAGEELGFAGHLLILAVFGLLVARMFYIGWRAELVGMPFQAYVCYGFATVFAFQMGINVGVNIGLLPTKGLTLPFISYGGASLLVSTMMVMMCQRIHHEITQLEEQ